MSVFPRDAARAVADAAGVSINDKTADALVRDAEFRIREVVSDAAKFMRYSRRSRLTSNDINAALAVRNAEHLYGYIHGCPSTFKSTIHSGQTLYYLNDTESDLDDLINTPLPPVPVDVTFTSHWLAIDGVQPRIIQNPSPADLLEKSTATTTTTVLRGNKLSTSNLPHVKDVLTQELQAYFDRIVEMLKSETPETRNLAIRTTTSDPGLQGLMPYFVQFISNTITDCILAVVHDPQKDNHGLDTMWTMVRFVRALLANKHLDPAPYLHQIIPSVMTCIITKSFTQSQNHWQIRIYAAKLLSHICSRYDASYPTMRPRATKTLMLALLDPARPLSTLFGALAALDELGSQVMRELVLPNVGTLALRLEPLIDISDSQQSIDAKKCRDLIVERMAAFFKRDVDVAIGKSEVDAGKSDIGNLDVDAGKLDATTIGKSQFDAGKSDSVMVDANMQDSISNAITQLKDASAAALGSYANPIFDAVARQYQ